MYHLAITLQANYLLRATHLLRDICRAFDSYLSEDGLITDKPLLMQQEFKCREFKEAIKIVPRAGIKYKNYLLFLFY